MANNSLKTTVPSPLPPSDKDLPTDLTKPIFDVAQEELPWSQDPIFSIDDDGNVLPGEDDIDDDPFDNGDVVLADLPENVPDLPVDADIDADDDDDADEGPL